MKLFTLQKLFAQRFQDSVGNNKRRDPKRGLAHTITLADLEKQWNDQQGICAEEGIKLSLEVGSPIIASLDRIKSDIGYVPGNIRWVTRRYNEAKGKRTDAVMLEMAMNIVKYKIKGE